MTKAEQVSLLLLLSCFSAGGIWRSLYRDGRGGWEVPPRAPALESLCRGGFLPVLRSEIVARGGVSRAPAVRIGSLVRRRLSRRRHALLLLPPVAEPHAHHLLLQLQRVRQRGDLLRGGLGTLEKVRLQNPLHADLDGRPLLPLPPLSCYLVYTARAARGRVCLLQPLVQQRL